MGEGSSCALTATVLELLPHGGVRVELESREQVLVHPERATKTNFLRLRPERLLAGGVGAG